MIEAVSMENNTTLREHSYIEWYKNRQICPASQVKPPLRIHEGYPR